ncbi:acyltransferase [Stenotrophomonas terrae]|uniref:acyltransferase n=1 Tax=Stenotrophomonas terrae TaxID=405446 RepID=UPI0009F979C2|nr:acyltransferase [Stenotrophomonas terrae]
MSPALVASHGIPREHIQQTGTVVVMGAGNMLQMAEPWLRANFALTHISDNHADAAQRYPHYLYVPPQQLSTLDRPFVIVTTSRAHYPEINAQLSGLGITHCLLDDIIGFQADIYPVIDVASLSAPYSDPYGNSIEWEGEVPPNLSVRFGRDGKDGRQPLSAGRNRLRIGAGCHFNGSNKITFLGEGSCVDLGAGTWMAGDFSVTASSNARFKTGERCTFEALIADVHEGEITFGDDCMVSVQVHLQQTDSHPIFDASSGERVNHGKHIRIGNHVWIGYQAFLLGGCQIGDDCIIGARAVTAGKFAPGTVLAGSPARVIRDNVTWRKDELTCSPTLLHLSDCKPSPTAMIQSIAGTRMDTAQALPAFHHQHTRFSSGDAGVRR